MVRCITWSDDRETFRLQEGPAGRSRARSGSRPTSSSSFGRATLRTCARCATSSSGWSRPSTRRVGRSMTRRARSATWVLTRMDDGSVLSGDGDGRLHPAARPMEGARRRPVFVPGQAARRAPRPPPPPPPPPPPATAQRRKERQEEACSAPAAEVEEGNGEGGGGRRRPRWRRRRRRSRRRGPTRPPPPTRAPACSRPRSEIGGDGGRRRGGRAREERRGRRRRRDALEFGEELRLDMSRRPAEPQRHRAPHARVAYVLKGADVAAAGGGGGRSARMPT